MKRITGLLLILALSACGPATASKSAGKNGKAKKPAVKSPAKAVAEPKPAPAPKKYIVAADAYSDIAAALEALLRSVETDGETNAADQDELLKSSAWLALQKEAALEPLAEKLGDEAVSLKAKRFICRTLGQIGPLAEAPLTAALESEQQIVRISAAEQLATIRPTNAKIIQTLIGLLDHEDPRTAECAVRSLAFIGPPAKESAEKLLAILNSDAEEGLRAEAKAALKKVNPRRTFQD